jgi:hypothetical protein
VTKVTKRPSTSSDSYHAKELIHRSPDPFGHQRLRSVQTIDAVATATTSTAPGFARERDLIPLDDSSECDRPVPIGTQHRERIVFPSTLPSRATGFWRVGRSAQSPVSLPPVALRSKVPLSDSGPVKPGAAVSTFQTAGISRGFVIEPTPPRRLAVRERHCEGFAAQARDCMRCTSALCRGSLCRFSISGEK